MSVSQIRYLNVVELGRGALQKLAGACQEHGIRRPLIVTDRGVRAAGLVDQALAQLAGLEHVAVYDGTPSNPTEAAAREACALARQEGCDGLVAVGAVRPSTAPRPWPSWSPTTGRWLATPPSKAAQG